MRKPRVLSEIERETLKKTTLFAIWDTRSIIIKRAVIPGRAVTITVEKTGERIVGGGKKRGEIKEQWL